MDSDVLDMPLGELLEKTNRDRQSLEVLKVIKPGALFMSMSKHLKCRLPIKEFIARQWTKSKEVADGKQNIFYILKQNIFDISNIV